MKTERPARGQDLVQALLEAIVADDDDAAEQVARACTGQTWLLPAIRPLMADMDVDRRWWAVRVAAVLGTPDAIPLLIERLADENEAVRCAAALGLGELKAEAGIPGLAGRLADQSGWVRDSAGDALARIGVPALPALVAALKDPRDPVRVRAAGAVRKIVPPALAGLRTNQFPPEYWPVLTVLFEALNDLNHLVRHNAYETLDRLGLFDNLLFQA
jgi:HEAT repeat protein